jgi:hypothetical protein
LIAEAQADRFGRMATVEPAAGPRGIERWAGLGGVLYVVLFVAGGILAFGGPDIDEPPAEFVSYYGDSGNRDQVGFGWALIVLGLFFFLWFLSALRQFLRRIDGDGFLTTLATLGGLAYASLTLAGISVHAAPATMSESTFRDRVYPEVIQAGNETGYVLHAAGGVGAGAMIIAASLAAMGAGLIPRWTGIVGVVVGVLALASITFLPQILIAVWLLVAGFLLFRTARQPAPRPAAPPPPGPAV